MLNDPISFEDLLPDHEQGKITSLLRNFKSVAEDAVVRNVEDEAVLAYSGGIDSTILSALLRRSGKQADLYTLGVENSIDFKTASIDATKLQRRTLKGVTRQRVEEAAKQVSKIVSISNLSHFEDCVCFWLIGDQVKKAKLPQLLVSGNGPDELFCGYDRFRKIVDSEGYAEAEKEILRALDSADYLRKEVSKVLSGFGLVSREPFLDSYFREFSLSKIPIEMKILKGNDKLRKRVWRALGRYLRVPEKTVFQPKKAMQYSMGIHPVVLSLLKSKRISIEFVQ